MKSSGLPIGRKIMNSCAIQAFLPVIVMFFDIFKNILLAWIIILSTTFVNLF